MEERKRIAAAIGALGDPDAPRRRSGPERPRGGTGEGIPVSVDPEGREAATRAGNQGRELAEAHTQLAVHRPRLPTEAEQQASRRAFADGFATDFSRALSEAFLRDLNNIVTGRVK